MCMNATDLGVATLRDAFLWGLLWIFAGGCYVGLVRRGQDYISHFRTTAAYFFVLSVLAALSFQHVLQQHVAVLGWMHLLLLVGIAILQVVAYACIRKWLRRPTRFIRAHPHVYFLQMDYRYLVSKPFEILFQQIMFGSLVLFLFKSGIAIEGIVPICIVLFAAIHVPLIKLLGRCFGCFYISSAVVAATVFTLLILGAEGGLLYSYLSHWLYYTVAGAGFWLYLDEVPRKSRRAANETVEASSGAPHVPKR